MCPNDSMDSYFNNDYTLSWDIYKEGNENVNCEIF